MYHVYGYSHQKETWIHVYGFNLYVLVSQLQSMPCYQIGIEILEEKR